MMNDIDNASTGDNLDDNSREEDSRDFGTMLCEARQAQNYSINDIFENIKIPEDILTAIESSDLAALPAPAFTQGYIRSYAKFLEISEDSVMSSYYQALPANSASGVRPNTEPSAKVSDQQPVMNRVTVILIITVLAVFFYGGLQFYQKNDTVIESELEPKADNSTGNSLNSSDSQQIEIEQNARMTEDGELIVENSVANEVKSLNDGSETEVLDNNTLDPNSLEKDDLRPVNTRPVKKSQDTELGLDADQVAGHETGQDPSSSEVTIETEAIDEALPQDKITFYAQDGSWLEVRDANDERLFYNMLPEGGSRTFTGRAPFSVFMGNATTSTVKINDIEVDYSVRIRVNNTVRFKVSNEDQKVIFHR